MFFLVLLQVGFGLRQQGLGDGNIFTVRMFFTTVDNSAPFGDSALRGVARLTPIRKLLAGSVDRIPGEYPMHGAQGADCFREIEHAVLAFGAIAASLRTLN